MEKMFKVFLVGLFLCFIADNSLARLSDEKVIDSCQKMDKIMKAAIDKLNIPGAVYAVSRHDKIVHMAAFGKTSIEKNSKEITQHTLFPVSSLSKNVTAILIGALIDDKKINLDEKVRKFLPDFFLGTEEISQKMTIRDLISHRSGFKHFSADSLFVANYDNEKIVRAFRILRQKPGKFRKEYGYQNIVFGIVGEVLEKATGEKYEDLVQKYIFNKMGMFESSCIPLKCEESFFSHVKYKASRISCEIKKYGFLAAIRKFFRSIFAHKTHEVVTNHSRYNNNIYPLEKNDFFQKFPATSAISMSANDLGKWLLMLSNKGTYNSIRIVSEEVFNELTSNMVDISNLKDDDVTFCIQRFDREGLYYGCGIFSTQYSDFGKNKRQTFFHMGGTYGNASFLAYSPKDDIAIGVLCNLGGVSQTLFSEYMTLQFLDLCFDFSKIDWTNRDLERKERFEKKNKEFKDSINQNIFPMEDIDKYVGTYTNDLYGDIKIYKENEKLALSNGIRTVALKHLNGNVFEFPAKDMLYSYFDTDEYAMFLKDNYENIDTLKLSCFHENNAVFKKVDRK